VLPYGLSFPTAQPARSHMFRLHFLGCKRRLFTFLFRKMIERVTIYSFVTKFYIRFKNKSNNNNSVQLNSLFNVLTQQPQEPIKNQHKKIK
jgi:hypothetical protein